MIEFNKLVNLIENYIDNINKEESAKKFCEEYMNIFYMVQDSLEQEISQNIYEIFDDINLTCDSYEIEKEIRKEDKYCIDEIMLKKKIVNYYESIIKKLNNENT